MSKHLQNTLTYLSVKEKGGEREKKKRDVFKDDIIQQRWEVIAQSSGSQNQEITEIETILEETKMGKS